ncbi:MAG: outer membrane beta-barrel protein [Terriglobales bacterium]
MRNRILWLLVFFGLIASASAQSIFDRLTWNAGAGESIGRGAVAGYVGNSPFAVAGGGMNFTRMFGADAEYMYYDLGFRPSVQQGQYLHDQTGHMQSISLDGVFNVPRHLRKFGAYGIFGIGFYDRTVTVPRNYLQAGTPYIPAYQWWDLTWQNNVFGTNLNAQYMSSNSKIAGGFNYGGGVTYPVHDRTKLYIEWRYHRAYQSDVQTIVMPVTVGLRW